MKGKWSENRPLTTRGGTKCIADGLKARSDVWSALPCIVHAGFDVEIQRDVDERPHKHGTASGVPGQREVVEEPKYNLRLSMEERRVFRTLSPHDTHST